MDEKNGKANDDGMGTSGRHVDEWRGRKMAIEQGEKSGRKKRTRGAVGDRA